MPEVLIGQKLINQKKGNSEILNMTDTAICFMEAMNSKTAAGRMPPHTFLFLDVSTGTSFCLYLEIRFVIRAH